MGTVIPATSLETLHVNDRYFGQSSLISMLQILNRSRGDHVNPQHDSNVTNHTASRSGATRSPRHAIPGPETPEATLSSIETYSLPSRSMADDLLYIYFNRIHIFYPWVHTQSFMGAYDSLWSGEEPERVAASEDVGLGGDNCSSQVFYCAVNIIFALACEFHGWPSPKREALSTMFYGRAKTLMDIALLSKSNFAVIQTSLLMAMYLQATRDHTLCWTLTGLACRGAQGMGLHLLSASTSAVTLGLEMRRRIWHGCVLMDMYVIHAPLSGSLLKAANLSLGL